MESALGSELLTKNLLPQCYKKKIESSHAVRAQTRGWI